MIEIRNGKIFIHGKQTVDAALIGYAILDLAETEDFIYIESKTLLDD